jgi:hypothetical protein
MTQPLSTIAASAAWHQRRLPGFPLYPPVDPRGRKVFNCPVCFTPNAVIEDVHGYHCRRCTQMFYEGAFDDWRDDTDDDDEPPT